MKILQITQFFTPERGGSAIVPFNLSKNLSEKGIDVKIITTDYHMNLAKFSNTNSLDISVFHSIVNLGGLLISPKMNSFMKRNINEFDLLHMHHFRSYPNLIAYYYAKKNNIPYIIQAHGSIPRRIGKQGVTSLIFKFLFDFFFGYAMLKHASKLIAVSHVEFEQYRSMGISKDKIQIVPNGVSVSHSSADDLENFKKKNGLENFSKVISYFGRIEKSKGIDLLIDAFNILINESNDNIVLLIVGPDDGYKKKLEDKIKMMGLRKKVKFIGYVNHPSVLYLNSDLIVYPPLYEIFGLVPFESIMCGTPVIVSDGTGCAELIKKSKSGFLFQYGNVSELKEKILLSLKMDGKNNDMVDNGKDYINNNLIWPKIVEDFEKLYSSCLRNNKAIKDI